MRVRRIERPFQSAVFAIAFLLLGAIFSYGQQKVIVPSPLKTLPYSDGVVVGNTLYIAGQSGEDENGKLKAPDIGSQTQGALENLAKVVKKAGFKLTDVVSVTVYLADFNEFEAMNKVYRAYMPEPKPARTTVQVVRLLDDARIEISAIAVKE